MADRAIVQLQFDIVEGSKDGRAGFMIRIRFGGTSFWHQSVSGSREAAEALLPEIEQERWSRGCPVLLGLWSRSTPAHELTYYGTARVRA